MSNNKKSNNSIDIRKININKNSKNNMKLKTTKEEKNALKTKVITKDVKKTEKNKLEVPVVNKKSNKKAIIISIIMTILIITLTLSIICNIYAINKKNKVKVVSKYMMDENIIFFGDSITSTYEVDHFYPNNYVVNKGVSGDKSEDLVNRLTNDVLNCNPSKVFVLVGINDLNHEVSEKDILKNIQKIINGIKLNRKHSKIYVQSIYPINQDLLKENAYSFNENLTNDDIIRINTKIKELCKKNNIDYIDIYSMLVDETGNLNPEYTKEGLHLNDLGYMKLTEKLENYIVK